MSSSIVIIGAGGHAVSVANVAFSSGYSVIALIDDSKVGETVLGIPVVSKRRCFEIYQDENFAIAVGDNYIRERIYREYKAELINARFPPLIHRAAVIGTNSSLGDGTVIMPQANVGPNSKVEMFCILNSSSSIDHDCYMGAFSSIGPGVITGGNVKIGERSAVLMGAKVKHGMVIGEDVVVGANSYVNRLIEDRLVAYGSPCKIIRQRNKFDDYLS